jgi:hypothetical protein
LLTPTPLRTRSELRKLWLVWFVILVVSSAIQLPTLTSEPKLFQDDAQVIEYGRTFLNPRSDWSINWTQAGRPNPTLFYVGCLAQEAAFRLGRGSTWGPRLTTLLGAMLAASLAMGWLLARGTRPTAAAALGFVFFTAPAFAFTYRVGRVDCWALATCFGGLWVLRSRFASRRILSACAVAGALAGLALFVWPSSLLVYPLLLAELLLVSRDLPGSRSRIGLPAAGIASAAVGALAAAAVLLIPLRAQLPTIARDWSAVWNVAQPWHMTQAQKTLEFLTRIQDYPLLSGLTVLAALRPRSWLLALATLASVAGMFTSDVYYLRFVYLLPAAVGLTAATFSESSLRGSRPLVVRLAALLLVATAAWAAGPCLLGRNLLGLRYRSAQNPAMLQSVADSLGTNKRVYLEAWEFYSAGRQLGWHMFKPAFPISGRDSIALLSRMDMAIVSGKKPSEKYITDAGLRFAGYLFEGAEKKSMLVPIFIQDSVGFGTYSVYARARDTLLSTFDTMVMAVQVSEAGSRLRRMRRPAFCPVTTLSVDQVTRPLAHNTGSLSGGRADTP